MLRSILPGIVALAASLVASSLVGGLSAQEKVQEKYKPVDLKIAGQIAENDPKDAVRNTPCKVHVVKLEKGKSYEIRMESDDFDTYLRVEDSTGNQLAEDDDGGGGLNSLIRLKADKDDAYKIIATTFGPNASGNYSLTVKDTNPGKAVAKEKDPKERKDIKLPKLSTPTEKEAIKKQDKIEDGDPIDPERNNASKVYTVELKEGAAYTIDMVSTDFDAYLRVLDADGNELADDDDSGGNLDARVLFIPEKTATYKVVATSFNGGTGAFDLSIKTADFGKVVKADPKKAIDAKEPFCLTGKLVANDPKDDVQQNSPHHVHLVTMKAGKTYVIDMMGSKIDSYLRVEDKDKKQLAEDDDGGDGLNSRLTFEPTADGVYRIIVTTFDGGEGTYLLAVREQK